MNLLEVDHIRKEYKKTKVIQDVSFSIKEKELVGLLGLNGAGKSTTIEMIATLLKPDAGNIYYRGKDIIKNPEIIRTELGYVPQEIMLFEELTGRRNLEFWGKAYGLYGQALKEAIKRTVEICELDEKIDLPVKEWSGGMKRRINIGAALLHLPRFLILDEATVGIDLLSANKILRLVQELNEQFGMTVLFTSHNMAELELICRRFLVLHQGRIISDISKSEIQKKFSNVQEYFLEMVR